MHSCKLFDNEQMARQHITKSMLANEDKLRSLVGIQCGILNLYEILNYGDMVVMNNHGTSIPQMSEEGEAEMEEE